MLEKSESCRVRCVLARPAEGNASSALALHATFVSRTGVPGQNLWRPKLPLDLVRASIGSEVRVATTYDGQNNAADPV
jgi:hypothetical protein